ncbi:MAG: hypothetical protein NW205_11730 [Hyphomicrobiaceae bacterium]|nr:hypothetical protein [Hyphomicrobiaceae bacterium]
MRSTAPGSGRSSATAQPPPAPAAPGGPDQPVPEARPVRRGASFVLLLLLIGGLWPVAPVLNAFTLDGLTLAIFVAVVLGPVLAALLAVWVSSPWATTPVSAAAPARATMSSPLLQGTALAALWATGAGAMALTASVYERGFDGMAIGFGCVAGLALTSILAGPERSVSSVTVMRRTAAARAAWALALAPAAAVCAMLLASAQIETLARLLPYIGFTEAGVGDHAVWMVALSSTIGLIALAAGLAGSGLAASTACVALATILTLVVLAASASLGLTGQPLPTIALGRAVHEVTLLERSMILAEIADPVSLHLFAKPYTSTALENVAALAATAMLGATGMCALLATAFANGTGSGSSSAGHGSGPWTAPLWSCNLAKVAAVAALLLAVLVPLATLLASAARQDLYAGLQEGASARQLPAVARTLQQAGHVRTCRSDPEALPLPVDAPCLVPDGRLKRDDVIVRSDALLPAVAALPTPIAPAAPQVIPAVAAVLGLGALLVGAAALAAGARAVASLAGGAGFALALSVLAAGGAMLAVSVDADVPTRLAWLLTAAAAGLAPPVVIALLAPARSGYSGLFASLVGLLVAAYYVIGTELFPLDFIDTWPDVSNAAPWRLEELAELRTACAGGDGTACSAAEALGRRLANWFGLDRHAAGVPGAFAGLAVGTILAWVLPRHRLS